MNFTMKKKRSGSVLEWGKLTLEWALALTLLALIRRIIIALNIRWWIQLAGNHSLISALLFGLLGGLAFKLSEFCINRTIACWKTRKVEEHSYLD